MSSTDRIELLQDIIDGSKRFEFATDDVLRLTSYYNGNKVIGINFTKLIEMLYEYDFNDNDIEDLLLTDDEIEGEY